uniref:Decaprenyl-diphosphate synthase subunit 2-like n=1 Tax=Hirondellea gigas TaxID=1518452 RepID=A0A2P2I9V7_9CRUS
MASRSNIVGTLLRKSGLRVLLGSLAPSSVGGRVLGSHQQCRPQSTHVDWQQAVSTAEKLVGYPTSYLTLRSLLSDEMSNVATHLRKLMATSHPLMDTAKQMVYEGPQSLQTRGLLVLLVSKAAATTDTTLLPQDTTAGVLHSQRSLAEITEMIHTAQLIHKGVVNLHYDGSELTGKGVAVAASNPDYEFGNKIAILCGDYLLANACKSLAALQNSQVVELVSSAIADFTEAEFLGLRDEFGRPVLSQDFTLDNWREKTFLSVGSLLAKASKSALLLAGHRDSGRLELAFAFGRQVALAWQGQQELLPFVAGDASSNAAIGAMAHKIDVTSLPVVLHIEHMMQRGGIQDLFDKVTEGRNAGEDLDQLLLQEVIAGGAGVPEGLQVVEEHCQEALRLLQVFPASEARAALANIIHALQSNNN